MADLIDRNVLLESLEIKDMPKTVYETGYCDSRTIAIYKISKMPTVDAEPIRHGRWECGGFCSECGLDNEERKTAYCPHCGARMDGGEKR